MTVKIGHAYSDENIGAVGGKAGDQTGKEVLVQDWYLTKGGWKSVFRAKERVVAERIAQAMEQACANDKIGYDQSQRTTLYSQAEKLCWDISKIENRCECDCSSLVSVCINASGVAVSKDMYTGNQKQVLLATSKFDLLEDSKYLTSYKHLRRGDVLLAKGHTAIVLTNGSNEPTVDKAKSFSDELSGNYFASANLNIRCGAGIHKSKIITIPKDTKVRCYGYYTKFLGTAWLYIQLNYSGTTYVGYASAKYLKKYKN